VQFITVSLITTNNAAVRQACALDLHTVVSVLGQGRSREKI
jgi:hypothetical protein